jgi:predicted nucleic acid-binding protein
MIAVDTSSFIAYLSGAAGPDVEATAAALEHRHAALPPVVLCELLSDPKLAPSVKDLFTQLPLLDLTEGYWTRAGWLRAKVIAGGRKAPLADTLIAQSCLDHDVALVTRDADFRHFVRAGGLRLFTQRAPA